jgi:hypothetical protein
MCLSISSRKIPSSSRNTQNRPPTNSRRLESKGFFQRFIGGITGSNKRLQDKINSNLRAAQYASQVTLQKLAEQNLMTFDLLTAVNNKLNASVEATLEAVPR